MVQSADVILRAEESPHGLAHAFAPYISGTPRRKTSPPAPRPKCKARDEKRGCFTPARHRDEVPLVAREISVYQPLEATKRTTEGDDGLEKSGR